MPSGFQAARVSLQRGGRGQVSLAEEKPAAATRTFEQSLWPGQGALHTGHRTMQPYPSVPCASRPTLSELASHTPRVAYSREPRKPAYCARSCVPARGRDRMRKEPPMASSRRVLCLLLLPLCPNPLMAAKSTGPDDASPPASTTECTACARVITWIDTEGREGREGRGEKIWTWPV